MDDQRSTLGGETRSMSIYVVKQAAIYHYRVAISSEWGVALRHGAL